MRSSQPPRQPHRDPGMVGHWPLHGAVGAITIPHAPALAFGTDDFTLSAWIRPGSRNDRTPGDLFCKYDARRRKGFTLSLGASAGGYSSQGDARHLHFAIDDGGAVTWEECGRPSPTSNYVSNSLTVFDGDLYAAITDAATEADWRHVFRYRGGTAWEDCGRVGKQRTHGVGPMVVHQGRLYAATWTYDWTRVGRGEPLDDFCCVYRYAGGTDWEECGQPGQNRRLFGLASFRGRLYVTAEDGRCYVMDGERQWRECGRFPNYAHPMGVHNGRLFAGVLNPAGVWSYDGTSWTPHGNPQGDEERCNQIHAFGVYRGRLHATTWPEGHVVALEAADRWVDRGRLGESMEVNDLAVYNGKLYGGTIPYAEVFRYDDDAGWTRLRRFYEPPGGEFASSADWARVTSLTIYRGKLFASIGSCTSAYQDAPRDVRGRVFAMEAGKSVTHDRDLGEGWKHVAAVRRGARLELYVDGEQVATPSSFSPADFDLSNEEPLRIGSGETGDFAGRIEDARVYNRALSEAEIRLMTETDRSAHPERGR